MYHSVAYGICALQSLHNGYYGTQAVCLIHIYIRPASTCEGHSLRGYLYNKQTMSAHVIANIVMSLTVKVDVKLDM